MVFRFAWNSLEDGPSGLCFRSSVDGDTHLGTFQRAYISAPRREQVASCDMVGPGDEAGTASLLLPVLTVIVIHRVLRCLAAF